MKGEHDSKPSPRAGMRDFRPTEISEEAFGEIAEKVLEKCGLDIGYYKDKCIKRRIAVRMRARGCRVGEEYLKVLKGDEGEFDSLLTTLTINVTQFFRNFSAFEKIREAVFPALFEKKAGEGDFSLRIWSVGCSSGEEPYTLAILLKEYFGEELREFSVEIVATDVDERMIERALQGNYDSKSVVEMPVHLRKKYFMEETGGRLSLAGDIKSMVTFRRKNILKKKMYKEEDLILCRNMLIYFTRDQQEKIILGFADSLNKNGILVLGKAETLVAESRKRFKSLCTRERIYEKIN